MKVGGHATKPGAATSAQPPDSCGEVRRMGSADASETWREVRRFASAEPSEPRSEVRRMGSADVSEPKDRFSMGTNSHILQGGASWLPALVQGQQQISEDVVRMSDEQRAIAHAISKMQEDLSQLLVAVQGGSALVPGGEQAAALGDEFSPSPQLPGAAPQSTSDEAGSRQTLTQQDVPPAQSAGDQVGTQDSAPRGERFLAVPSPAPARRNSINADVCRLRSADSIGQVCRLRSADSERKGGSIGTRSFMLEDGWPANIKARKGVDELRKFSQRSSSMKPISEQEERVRLTLSSSVSGLFSDLESSMGSTLGLPQRRIMVDPNSIGRMSFDAIGMAVIAFDIIVIPYLLAWDMPFEGFVQVMAWISCIFWTVEILFNFFTGLYVNGKLESDPRVVARAYLTTWFFPDLGVAVCDWISMILMTAVEDGANSSGGLRMLRFAKAGRLLRILRVLRMTRVFSIAEDYIEAQASESYKVVLRVSILSSGALFLNHWISCLWIAVGRAGASDTGFNWVDVELVLGGERLGYMHADKWYQYTTAFHWSFAQFTLGAMEISSTNTVERIFSIACLMVGLTFGSTFVSSLSAMMVDSQMLKKDRTLKMRRLREFLRENAVDRCMVARVQQQAQERLAKREQLQEQDVPALQLLSRRLRMELRFGIFQQHLLTHPLFRLWSCMDSTMVQRLCDETIAFIFLREKDDLFVNATRADSAYYLVSGTMHYLQEFEGSEDPEPEVVSKDTWMCEAALWTDWMHVGRAEAATRSKVISVSSRGLLETVKQYRKIREVTMEYARHFHRRVVTAYPPASALPTDISVPFTGWDDMVIGLDRNAQLQVGAVALEQLSEDSQASFASLFRTGSRGLDELKSEVLKGKSCLLVNADGEVQRVCSVVVLRIERRSPEGTHILVQLGKLQDGELQPSCELPGGKQKSGELIGETLERLLGEKLQAFSGNVQFHGRFRKVQWASSKNYSVRTKYLKTVCTASLINKIEAKMLVISGVGKLDHVHATPSGSRHTRVFGARSNEPLLQELEVLVVDGQDGDPQLIFAWLLEEDFERFSAAANAPELSAYMASLQQQLRQAPNEPAPLQLSPVGEEAGVNGVDKVLQSL